MDVYFPVNGLQLNKPQIFLLSPYVIVKFFCCFFVFCPYSRKNGANDIWAAVFD